MNNNVLFLIIAILLIALSFYGGYNYGKGTIVTRIRDTVYEVKLDKIIIKDTVTKKIVRTIPTEIDSNAIKKIIKERDSLVNELIKFNVKEIAVLDTIYGEYKDTINVKFDMFLKHWDLYIGLANRKVLVEKELIYLPPPSRQWWDNPYVGLGFGLIIGGGSVYFLKN